MTERVLVTGGAGFVGSHVAERYLVEGYAVTVLDNLSSGRREQVPAAADFVRADVESPEARELVRSGGFAVLNHHAAQMDVRVSVADPELDMRINIQGLLNLLEGCRESGVKRVVFASSGGVVYGESALLPHPERAPKQPVSPYGVSKLASEYYLAAYRQLHGLDVVSLRYANVYGPRQSPHGEAGVVAIFGSRLHRGRALTVYGDGTQTRDYVFVGDVARANLSATRWTLPATSHIDDLAVNVGTGVETSVNDLVEALFEAAGRHVEVTYALARAGELMRSAVSCERAGDEWDWRPEVELVQGLEKTYGWVAEQAA